jgi:hypothetical protein
MKYYFSPHTGEIINTDTPSDWMSFTDIAPPQFNPQEGGCFFREGTWVVVSSLPDIQLRIKTEAIAAIDAQLLALDAKRIRSTAEDDTAYLTTLNTQAIELRAQRAAL